jgi:hypothetical protein
VGQKFSRPQVTRREWVTTENFGPDFRLTGEPLGNKIQLPKFLTVAIPSITDSPIEHHPCRTGGYGMLILRGEHFFFVGSV